MTSARSGTVMPQSFSTELHVGQVVLHPGQVVDPVGVGDELVPVLAFADLLGAAVVVADIGLHIDDLFAVELEHAADNAVGAGVLRAEVEDQGLRRPCRSKKSAAGSDW